MGLFTMSRKTRGPGRATAEREAKVRELCRAGFTDAQTGQVIGLTASGVQRIRLKLGGLCPKNIRRQRTRALIKQLFGAGWSDERIARDNRIQRSVRTVRSHRAAMGLRRKTCNRKRDPADDAYKLRLLRDAAGACKRYAGSNVDIDEAMSIGWPFVEAAWAEIKHGPAFVVKRLKSRIQVEILRRHLPVDHRAYIKHGARPMFSLDESFDQEAL